MSISAAYNKIKELDNDESSIVELVENEKKERFVRRIMHGKINVYLALEKLPHKFLPKVLSAEYNGKNTVVIEEYIENNGDVSSLKSEKEIVGAMCELCEVLDFIHKHDIIHRDIKPSNILVATDGHIRLIDFDAARQRKDEASNDTRYLGTKGYAPPEQFGFAQTDYTADIYAFGVTMKNVMGSLADSRKYKGIIRKCTEFDPENRYKNAAAVKASLILGRKRYYFEAALSVLVCAIIIFSVSLMSNHQNRNTDELVSTENNTVIVSESIVPQTETTTVTEPTSLNETTVTAVTAMKTVSETISEETETEVSSATTTAPATEAEEIIDVSVSLAEAQEISDEEFELISPRNEKLIPRIARKEISEEFYTDYFVDDYRYVSDRAIIGRWESIAKMDTFDPKLIKKYFTDQNDEHVKEVEIGNIQSIEFTDNGKCFSYYNTYASISEWTYGAIINDYFIDARSILSYYIFRVDGVDYLFIEGKMDDRDIKEDRTAQNCVVFKKFIKEEKPADTVETTTAVQKEVVRKVISPTDESKFAKFLKKHVDGEGYYDFLDGEYEFVNDPNVIGSWKAIDFTYDYPNYVYDKNNAFENLWHTGAEFKSDGSYICYTTNNPDGALCRWTYGQTINTDGNYHFVNRYYLCYIDNEEYLFIEFKNGDYVRNDDWVPGWYIYIRE